MSIGRLTRVSPSQIISKRAYCLLLIDICAEFSADVPEPDVAPPAVEVFLFSRARFLRDDFTPNGFLIFSDTVWASPNIPSRHKVWAVEFFKSRE